MISYNEKHKIMKQVTVFKLHPSMLTIQHSCGRMGVNLSNLSELQKLDYGVWGGLAEYSEGSWQSNWSLKSRIFQSRKNVSINTSASVCKHADGEV